MMKFRRTVKQGTKNGRKIGYPTINLDVGDLIEDYDYGVYLATVHIGGREYKGAMHFGPKHGDLKPALEIHIPGIDQDLYGMEIEFIPLQKIRDVRRFDTLDELKNQIAEDLKQMGF